jgi:hypothetical protein
LAELELEEGLVAHERRRMVLQHAVMRVSQHAP